MSSAEYMAHLFCKLVVPRRNHARLDFGGPTSDTARRFDQNRNNENGYNGIRRMGGFHLGTAVPPLRAVESLSYPMHLGGEV